MKKTYKSLRDKILTADSKTGVHVLLEAGAAFRFASGATRRRWRRAAVKTLAKF